jgi:uncharacterized protein
MDERRILRWRDALGHSIEHCVVTPRPDGFDAESVVVAESSGARFAVSYRILCDSLWRTRALAVGLIGAEGRQLTFTSDGYGGWSDGNGRARDDLQGAIDVDISVTPFTNTLPIRRLAVRPGDVEEIAVLYVDVPELEVGRRVQRYTGLAERRVRFESLDSDFRRDLELDAEGYVVLYPGLFQRLA